MIERRCLILSSEFYEWRHICSLNKRTNQPIKPGDKFPAPVTAWDDLVVIMEIAD